jgi:hypothetical protein
MLKWDSLYLEVWKSMEDAKLRQLLSSPESEILDFKRQSYFHLSRGPARDQAKDAFARQILAFANGNIDTVTQEKMLVFGVDNAINPTTGYRTPISLTGTLPRLQEIIQLVNDRCTPRLGTLYTLAPQIDQQQLFIIIIPPSSRVHRTIRELKTKPNTSYKAHSIFIRSADTIMEATDQEAKLLQVAKDNHALRQQRPSIKFTLIMMVCINWIIVQGVTQTLALHPLKSLTFLILGSLVTAFAGGLLLMSRANGDTIIRDWPFYNRRLKIALLIGGFILISFVVTILLILI